MITPYPFFGFPNFRRTYPYSSAYNSLHNTISNDVHFQETAYSPSNLRKSKEQNFHGSSFVPEKANSLKHEPENTEKDTEEFFDFFGLKLHFDDLLLIALLFFLYQEDVKDTYLYVALILLLLS